MIPGNLAVNTRLGVGNPLPQEQLHVAQNARIDGQLLAHYGNAGTPGISFAMDNDTGIFTAGNDVLAFTTAGIERARIYEDGAFQIGSQQNPATLGVYGSALIGGDIIINNKIGAGVQPQEQLHIAQNARVDSQFLAADGSSQAPSYSFANSRNTGIYHMPENSIALSTKWNTKNKRYQRW